MAGVQEDPVWMPEAVQPHTVGRLQVLLTSYMPTYYQIPYTPYDTVLLLQDTHTIPP